MGPNNLAVLQGQGQILWLEDRIGNDKYTIHRIHTEYISRTLIVKTTWTFRLVHKHLRKSAIRLPHMHWKWLSKVKTGKERAQVNEIAMSQVNCLKVLTNSRFNDI